MASAKEVCVPALNEQLCPVRRPVCACSYQMEYSLCSYSRHVTAIITSLMVRQTKGHIHGGMQHSPPLELWTPKTTEADQIWLHRTQPAKERETTLVAQFRFRLGNVVSAISANEPQP